MRDAPGAVDLLQAHGRAEPEIRLFAVRLGSAHPLQAGAVGDVAVRRDAEIADLKADRPVPGGEPVFQNLSDYLPSRVLQRRCEIERQNVGRKTGHCALHVLGAEGLRPASYYLTNLDFIICFAVFSWQNSLLIEL
jgi:hypothetical protein